MAVMFGRVERAALRQRGYIINPFLLSILSLRLSASLAVSRRVSLPLLLVHLLCTSVLELGIVLTTAPGHQPTRFQTAGHTGSGDLLARSCLLLAIIACCLFSDLVSCRMKDDLIIYPLLGCPLRSTQVFATFAARLAEILAFSSRPRE